MLRLGALAAVALFLAACTSPPHGPDAPPASDPGAAPGTGSSPAPSTAPQGRQGWRVTGENVLGEWQPNDTCGGEYVFRFGISLRLLESLTDLEGNETYDGPYAQLRIWEDGDWGYYWSNAINSVSAGWTPGAWVDGGKAGIDFGPDADGHPPRELVVTGGWNTRVLGDLGTATERGVDSFTFRFERIPEPEWCLEQYEYDLGTEYEWDYYD